MKKLAAVLIVLVAVVAIAIYAVKQYKKFYPPSQDVPQEQMMPQPGQQPAEVPGR